MKGKKSFSWSKGKYYFTVKSSPNNITMFRTTKEAAAQAFQRYVRIGKETEWLGMWNGKSFVESTPPELSA